MSSSKKERAPKDEELPAAFITFVNEAITNFHAVETCVRRLKEAGYQRLDEAKAWKGAIQKGGKYFLTRNASAVFAFTVGGKYTPGDGAISIVGHTDSPCLKLKPISKRTAHGCKLLGVQTYGGGLWTTWFDRDLSVAGRVLIRERDGRIVNKLVRIEKPCCRISSLAIHLNRGSGTKFEINAEDHLAPCISSQLGASAAGGGDADDEDGSGQHDTVLLKLLVDHLGLTSSRDIVDFELQLYDTQPSQIGGAADDLLFSGRLDNLCSVYCGLQALIDDSNSGQLQEASGIKVFAGFDHEEIGSRSAVGAAGSLMNDVMKRVVGTLSEGDDDVSSQYERFCQSSLIISADMAHAIHPNYSSKHEKCHQPRVGGGMVIKHNVNQRVSYTTNTCLHGARTKHLRLPLASACRMLSSAPFPHFF